MLIARASCRFDTITPALLRLLSIIEEYTRAHNLTVILLTGTEGHHTLYSRHAQGEAVDLKVDLPTPAARESFLHTLLVRLGPTFHGYIAHGGERNEYIHLQVRRGATYVPTPVPHDPPHRFDTV